jgi:hypothetical protein
MSEIASRQLTVQGILLVAGVSWPEKVLAEA